MDQPLGLPWGSCKVNTPAGLREVVVIGAGPEQMRVDEFHVFSAAVVQVKG
jgi:hypothetical protein